MTTMSKKSHPGDGSYGKGVKGERTPFDEVFRPKSATQRKEANQDEQSSEQAESTNDRG